MLLKWTTALFVTLTITACGSSSDDTPSDMTPPAEMEPNPIAEFASHTCAEPGLLTSVYKVASEAECIDGDPPEAVGTVTFDAAESLTPALQLIPGGSQTMQIRSESTFFEIYVSEPGRYFKLTKSTSTNGDVFFVGFQPTLEDDVARSVNVQIATAEGAISEPVSVPFEAVEIGTGELQISLTWSNAAFDLDLQVQAADGAFINRDNPTRAAGGTLDLTSNNDCVIDNVQDENIFFEPGMAQDGAYQLTVTHNGKCGSTSNFAAYVITVRSDNDVLRFHGSLDTENETAGDGFTYIDGVLSK